MLYLKSRKTNGKKQKRGDTMKTAKNNAFIREANRQSALDTVTADREKMAEDEIVSYLLKTAEFREAEAWEIAEKLKR